MQSSITTSLAFSAAALFLGACSKGGEAPPPAAPSEETAAVAPEAAADAVKCLGINECKAQAQCSVPGGHSCAGQNECKGKGWIQVSKADCESKGGTVL